MVARNRYEGGGTPDGWDDLPARVRDRFHPHTAPDTRATTRPTTPPDKHSWFAWVHDVSRLAVLFLLVAVANVVVLLLALWFLRCGATTPALPLLDPLPIH